MRPLLKRFLPLVVILVALAGFVVLRMTRPEPPPAGDEERRWPIAVMQVQPGDYAPQLRLFGELTSQTNATLRARTAGDVQEIRVREGQQVSQGQVLLQLDDLDARALYHQRQAELQDLTSQLEQLQSQHRVDQEALVQEKGMLVLAERQYNRMRQLADANRASQREVDEAQLSLTQQHLALMNRELAVDQYSSRLQQLQSNLQRARTQQQLAQRDLEATQLKAPTDLRVQEILVGEGDRVAGQAPLISVFVPEQLEMKARLPVSHVDALQSALAAQKPLYAQAKVGDEQLVFELQELAGHTRNAAGIEAVFTLAEGRPEGLALGRFIDAHLSLPELKAVFWLPVAAVQGRNRIYRVVDSRLEGLDVELKGNRVLAGEPGVLVSSEELQAGDEVLVNRLPNAMQSLLVEVMETRDLADVREAAE
ncbi:biotin/lipoyl-binding protein [Marinospirillum sp.]|uniref:efflux RND transporter periplasmic adaptor subunit n=1 Tax=Marinospirillum sp. TaxID=2183934 RepID=UPI00286FAF60|nr:biotin/lipoyl-binding protein [Marinospirillum sp.]MDR9467697.1 biotin/lipoyl-binding protein [Marinospirillum sp.]